MKPRTSVGYVVKIEGARVTLNLFDVHKGSIASHSSGISEVTELGALLAIDAGIQILVFQVESLSFAEPKDTHLSGIRTGKQLGEPLRQMSGTIKGKLLYSENSAKFTPGSLETPPLGAEVYPLLEDELSTVLNKVTGTHKINLGKRLRGSGPVYVSPQEFIGRHVAVLGGTGQGKSCFTASILQQLVTSSEEERIIIFDINGEYEQAFDEKYFENGTVKTSKIGGKNDSGKNDSGKDDSEKDDSEKDDNGNKIVIPYYALGRQGLHKLLMPSDKSQWPALKFALENLNKVEWFPEKNGLGLVGETEPSLFDDCRPDNATKAHEIIDKLRTCDLKLADKWPPMNALCALIADSYSLSPNRNSDGFVRDSFTYKHIAPLITRIQMLLEDPMFTSVIDVKGGKSNSSEIDWKLASSELVEDIFGGNDASWKVHILDLREIPQDLSPFILGAILDLYSSKLFERGQESRVATLLVLEEAHHYLRNIVNNEDGNIESIAYERLAKEGRKFGLSLWLSTQRPSEISTTVLSQCNNWVCFRLTSNRDLSTVQSANEWVSKNEVQRISGLSRKQALVFGGGLNLPTLIESNDANPLPKSEDAIFEKWGLE